ncbi:hypothetical protein JJD41_15225 [Oxynema sp. CENA135]|nr:hypothetical protein [Oxynema sp. CENA135]
MNLQSNEAPKIEGEGSARSSRLSAFSPSNSFVRRRIDPSRASVLASFGSTFLTPSQSSPSPPAAIEYMAELQIEQSGFDRKQWEQIDRNSGCYRSLSSSSSSISSVRSRKTAFPLLEAATVRVAIVHRSLIAVCRTGVRPQSGFLPGEQTNKETN